MCSKPNGVVRYLGDGGCVCDCKAGWGGEDCSTPVCPKTKNKECGGPLQGKTVFDKGRCKCKCLPGYIGDACEIPVCPFKKGKLCSGKGRAVMIGASKCKCVCKKPWAGKDCSEPTCPKSAKGDICGGVKHGQPKVDPKTGVCTCICKPGFGGLSCDEPACATYKGAQCGGQTRGVRKVLPDGKCICKCKEGWKGDSCEVPLCLLSGGKKYGNHTANELQCSGNGVGVFDKDGKCVCKCNKGWQGTTCDKEECPKGPDGQVCSGKGTVLITGTKCECKCNEGWGGTDCGRPGCEISKVYKRECGGAARGFKKVCGDKCSCVCLNGWKGAACDQPDCEKNTDGEICGGRGKCVQPVQSGSDSFCTKPPQTDIKDLGQSSKGKGWYDVQQQGCCNDFCRFVSDAQGTWWSCALAGSKHQYTAANQYSFTQFQSKVCRKKGEMLLQKNRLGKCLCDDLRWTGAGCDQTVCPIGGANKKICSGRGDAQETWEGSVLKKCSCKCTEPGWTGAACDQTRCPLDLTMSQICSGHGSVELSAGNCKCKCNAGWTGDNCGTPACKAASTALPALRSKCGASEQVDAAEAKVCGGPERGAPTTDGKLCKCACKAPYEGCNYVLQASCG